MFDPSPRTTRRNERIPLIDVGLALAALVPIIAIEILNYGRISPVALPFLLVGVVVGARRGWPLWSLWWLGWTFSAAVLAALFWLPGPGRQAIVTVIWELLLAAILLSVGLAIWQRGNGFRVAFAMFPCALGFTRFVLFDDLPADATLQFLLMHAAAILVCAGVAILTIRQRSRRARWLVLIFGTLAYFVTALIVSVPILFFFAICPAYLPVLAILAFAPLVIGLGLDGYRARRRLSIPIRIALLAVIVLSIASPLPLLLTGDALPASPYAPVAAQAPGPRQAVIIDTDLSLDDYVAILYLLQHPNVDILGITVVNGVAHVEPGLENMRRLLAMADREDIPVAAGPSAPLVGENAFPGSMRSSLDLLLRPAFPKPAATATNTTTAPGLIHQLVADSPTPVSFVALGPLSNIALVLQDDPSLASRFDTILFSGGAIDIEGLSDPRTISDWDLLMDQLVSADWNVFIDPYAANIVLRSGTPLVLVPLDVTDRHGPSPILITRNFADRFAAATHGRESWLMAHIIKGWLAAGPGMNAAGLWDAPAVAIATDPNICTDWSDLSIYVALEPAGLAGKTIVESGQPNARVCLSGNQTAFEEAYLITAH